MRAPLLAKRIATMIDYSAMLKNIRIASILKLEMALALLELGLILAALALGREFASGGVRLLVLALTLALGGLAIAEFWIALLATLGKWGSRHVLAHCIGMVFCAVFWAVNMSQLLGRP
jgi:hypothetical protein